MSETDRVFLEFQEPKQKKHAPKHLADMSKEERKALCTELGIPAFRANQVAVHYYTHLAKSRWLRNLCAFGNALYSGVGKWRGEIHGRRNSSDSGSISAYAR